MLKEVHPSSKGNNKLFFSKVSIEDAPYWLPKASFSRTDTDLIAISPDGEKVFFIDYFTNFELPSIRTENGLVLKGSLLETLAGPLAKGQYAQAAGDGTLSIGEVSSISGTVKATRLDGNIFELNTGDPVFQGDTIETQGSGAVGLVFLDKTTLSLSDGGKMVLDELVYDPATGTGSMGINMVEGAFSFISGEIAKTGPDAMQIETPVVTMGIRGTTVAGKAAIEGNENAFTLLQDADGGVGQISVSNDGGTQVLSQIGATTTVSSFTAPPPAPVILSAAQIQANYGAALNVLPPTPIVAPTPQSPPPPQEQQQEQQVQEEASEEEGSEEEGTSEETAPEGEGDGPSEGEEVLLEEEGEGIPEGEEGLEDEAGPDGPPEGEEGPPEGEAPGGLPEGEAPPVGDDSPGPEEQVAAREAFDTAIAAGGSPEQAMAEAAATAGLEEELPGGPGDLSRGPLDTPINTPLGNMGVPGMSPLGISTAPGSSMPGIGSDTSIGNILGPNMGSAFGPGPADMFAGPMIGTVLVSMSGPGDMIGGLMDQDFGLMGPGLGFNRNDAGLNPYGNTPLPVTEFFEDPSLYDDYQKNRPVQEEASSELANFTINGSSDFGTVISNFSITSSLNIKYNFDQPSSSYSVSRSNYYEYDSTTQNLRWDSKPSTSSQTVTETESNGSFGSAQAISRSSFKIATNSDVGDDTIPWVKIQSGWINNGVDLFKVDLQAGETLIVDVDYGDAFSDSLNTYVTLYNSSQNSVAENDDSAINQGGAGSSGTGDSYISYTSTTSESFYIFLEDSPKNNNSNTAGDYVINLSITPTSSSTGLGTSSTSSVGGNNKLPYVFNFTEDTSNYMSKTFKSDLISSIRYTDSVSGTGSEVFLIAGDGTNSAIWLWDDLSEGYGLSNNELTLVASLQNFDNDDLTGSEIIFSSL